VHFSHIHYLNVYANIRSPKPPPPFIPSFEQLRIARRHRDAEINSRLRGPPLPACLSPEGDAEVARLLKQRGIVAKVARLQVTDADLSRLRPNTWLNDEVINFYGQLILERSAAHPKNKGVKNGARSEKSTILDVHYFNSFFFEKLASEGYEKARLAKWTKQVRRTPPHLRASWLTPFMLVVWYFLERHCIIAYQPWQLALDGGSDKFSPTPNRIVR
jgi:hypothetical protein